MAQLTPQQIAQLAYNAGFRGAALNQAVAIALAESGGRTDAYNPETAAGTQTGSGSRGLWQIYGTAHPEYNNSQAFDPQVNANAAFKVFMEAGKSFRPWSTYNLGTRATVDYAASIKGAVRQTARALGSAASSQRPAPVRTVATGTQTPVNNWRDLLALPTSQPSAPAIKSAPGDNEVNLPFGININKSDIAFVFFGSGFILFGVIFLLIAGTATAANTETGRAVIKTAAQLAV